MSRFRWQRVTCIIHRDTEDGYPDWRKILPGRSDKAWTVEREALLATGKRMLVLANRASHRVHVSFNGVSGIVETPHEGSGQPHAREVVGGEYKGGDFLLAMNISYLTDLLKRVPEEHVRMWFGTQESAIEIESVRTSDAPLPALSQRFLLMPMRVLG